MRALVLLFLLVAAAHADPLQLDFQGLSVRLYPEVLYYDDGKYKVTYDFPTLRVYSESKEGVDNSSLYARVGGREIEFLNRLQMRKALSAANVTEPSMTVPQLEHLFSLRDPQSKTNLSFDGLTVKSGKAVLLEWSKDGLAVDPETARLYVRFLRYYVGGHPDALQMLQKRNMIPKTLTITQLNVKNKRVTKLTLLKNSVPGPPSLPNGSPPIATSPVAKLLSQAATITLAPDYGLKEARQRFSEKQYLQSFLRYFDNGLSLGGELAPDFKAKAAIMRQDPEVEKLTAALQGNDAAGLQAIEGPAGDMSYVVKVFRGGLIMENEPETAYKLYVEALEAQPGLSGAWKDLGEIYYRTFEAVDAWRCWDTARRLAPQHQLLQEVKALETRLRGTYPEYF